MVDVVFLGFVVNLCGSPWITDLNLYGSLILGFVDVVVVGLFYNVGLGCLL